MNYTNWPEPKHQQHECEMNATQNSLSFTSACWECFNIIFIVLVLSFLHETFCEHFPQFLEEKFIAFFIKPIEKHVKRAWEMEIWNMTVQTLTRYELFKFIDFERTLKFALEEVISNLCNKKQFNYSFAVSFPHFFACLQTFYQTKTFLHELSLWN